MRVTALVPGIGISPVRLEPLDVGVDGLLEQPHREERATRSLRLVPLVFVHAAQDPVRLAAGDGSLISSSSDRGPG